MKRRGSTSSREEAIRRISCSGVHDHGLQRTDRREHIQKRIPAEVVMGENVTDRIRPEGQTVTINGLREPKRSDPGAMRYGRRADTSQIRGMQTGSDRAS